MNCYSRGIALRARMQYKRKLLQISTDAPQGGNGGNALRGPACDNLCSEVARGAQHDSQVCLHRGGMPGVPGGGHIAVAHTASSCTPRVSRLAHYINDVGGILLEGGSSSSSCGSKLGDGCSGGGQPKKDDVRQASHSAEKTPDEGQVPDPERWVKGVGTNLAQVQSSGNDIGHGGNAQNSPPSGVPCGDGGK